MKQNWTVRYQYAPLTWLVRTSWFEREGTTVWLPSSLQSQKEEGMLFQEFGLQPFGAVRSVHSFLRLARALWWLGVTGCCIIWTSFYDDFISFSRPKLVGSTEKIVAALFKLLGWIFAEEGDKAQPF